MSSSRNIVTRRDFIAKLMHSGGLTYDQACRAYNCLVDVVESGVLSGAKIGFGNVGSLIPVVKPPRDVAMNFKSPTGAQTRKVFHLGERTNFEFRLFRTFVEKNQLRG